MPTTLIRRTARLRDMALGRGTRLIRRIGSPPQVGTILIWLDADRITGLSDGEAVATWLDRSGSGNDATQAAGASRGVYKVGQVNGRSVVRFDLATQGMMTDLDVVNPYTLAVVFNRRGAGSDARRTVQGAVVNWLVGAYASEVRMFADTGFVSTGVAATQFEFFIAIAIGTGSASAFWVNGVNQTTDATPTASPRVLSLGAAGGNPEGVDGDIAELIVYDSAFDANNRQALERYLGSKYGISLG